MTRKPKAFSGIQPNGTVYIGNYLDAIRNWASMLDDYDCVCGIVDYHARPSPTTRPRCRASLTRAASTWPAV